jgi:hypothetical protein
VGALYGVSYTLKFASKKRAVDPIDYTVMALEGLWTTPEGGADYATSDQWQWTLMMMQPEHITGEMFAEAVEALRKRQAREAAGGGSTGPGRSGVAGAEAGQAALDRLRLERFAEGLCVQIMHVGPYADEPRTLQKMKEFVDANGYAMRGRHHEIYMGDPRTAKPENLRTVLRHAVVKTAERGGG